MLRSNESKSPQSRTAPEPEGPEEVYRKFERLNRRRGSGRPDLAGLSGRKALYGVFAAVELAAIVGGFLLGVPYLDTLAFVLPGLLLLLPGGSKEEPESPGEARPASDGENEPETPLEDLLERLQRRFGDPGSAGR